MHDAYRALLRRSHPCSHITIDKVRVYGKRKIVFFRTDTSGQFTQNRIAVFSGQGKYLTKENDFIVSIDD